jgi:hypothetical protein
MPEVPPAALEEFRQVLGVEPGAVSPPDWGVSTDGWSIEGGHGTVSCKPEGGFHILIFGYTDHGQERAIAAFAKFARLIEIGEDGGRLFTMARLPDRGEAAILRRWLALRP